MTPEISIVVPVYNVGATLLSACIESALNQTFTDFELILVDDASTDDSAAVCASFTDPRIRLIRLPQNGGLSNARNVGVAASRGSFISFLDADDRIHPSLLMRLRNIVVATGADIAAAGFQRIEASTPVPTIIPEDATRTASPDKAIEDALYQESINHSACGKLYLRDICTTTPFRPGWYEDLRTFYLMFLKARKIAWTTEPLYLYTVNPSSYIHTFNLGRAVVLDVTDELVQYMEAHRPNLLPAARDRALSAAFNILNLLTVNGLREPKIEQRCRNTIRRYRRASLFNPRVRLKNKLGILATYLGGFSLLRLLTKVYPPR